MSEAERGSFGTGSRDGVFGLGVAETNRIYQAGLLEAEDLWQWEAIVGGASGTKTKGFVLEGVDRSSSEPGRLSVWLQGGSDADGVEDHHVRVFVGPAGSPVLVGEARFDGKRPYRLDASVPASLLQRGCERAGARERGGHRASTRSCSWTASVWSTGRRARCGRGCSRGCGRVTASRRSPVWPEASRRWT